MLPTQPSTPSVESSSWRHLRLGLLVWVLILGCGFGGLISYQMRAGTAAVAPGAWPACGDLPFDSQRYNLVMFAHPQCPCSDASLEELKIVLTQSHGEIKSTVCFFDPDGAPADWEQTSLVQAAKSIPGLSVVMDQKGTITEKFGAMTSGQVLMFDRRGNRVFAGGITGARGHAGDNRGRTLVLALAKGELCADAQTSVFGCALHDATGPTKATP